MDTNVLGHIGTVHVELGNHTEAIQTLSNLLELDPTAMMARCHRAQASIHQGQYDDALADLQIVKQYDPNNPDLYFNLGLIDQYRGDYHAALSNYEQAKALNCTRHGLDYKIEEMKDGVGE